MTKQLEALIAEMKAAAEAQDKYMRGGAFSIAWDESITPKNVMALIAALEQAQRANAAQDDHINKQQDRIEQLEKGHQEAAKQIQSWRRLAKQNIAEREKDIAELDAARKRIAELEVALFEAETKSNEFADEIFSLKLNELEASPLAVKLPAPLMPAQHASGELFMTPDNVEHGGYLNRDDVLRAIRAAGGTVEGE